MYKEFYGLREKPFVLTPDPQFLFLSESHRAPLNLFFTVFIRGRGFILITGDIGTGRRPSVEPFEKLDKNVKTAVIFNSFLTEEELLESILLDFGFPSKGEQEKSGSTH